MKIAARLRFPVVLKIVSDDILHKTEAGGVIVGVKSASEARRAFDRLVRSAKAYKKNAAIQGVQVQQMLGGGREVMVGAVTDPTFGKLVAFGLGGVLVEVMKDITFRLAPVSKKDALAMLDGISGAEILRGVRGAKGVDRGGARRYHSKSIEAGQRFPRDRGSRFESDFCHRKGRSAPWTCASSSARRCRNGSVSARAKS